MAGRVTVRVKGRQDKEKSILEADEVYYDTNRNVALALNARLQIQSKRLSNRATSFNEPVYVIAREIQQTDENHFKAIEAEVSAGKLPADPGLKLIVDTCIGNDKPRSMLGGAPLQTAFPQSLEAAGCKREDIDTVICTHLHVDHVGWNTMLEGGKWVPTFPNARYLIGKQESAHWKNDSDAETRTILGDSVQPIFDHGLVDLR